MTDAYTSRRARQCAGAELVIASFIVLFQEMTLIRWLPSQVRVVAYFPNVVLISAFLGLGMGSLRAGGKSLLWIWPVSLLTIVAATVGMSQIAFTQEGISEHLWLLYYDIPNAPVVNEIRIPIVAIFILSCISFIPLGQIVAQRLRLFRTDSSLWGYACDLSGSLAGVAGFAAASFLQTKPLVWFIAFLLPAGWFMARSRWRLGLYALCMIAAMTVLVLSDHGARYSPYYAIKTRPHTNLAGFEILANGSLHQYAAPLANADSLHDDFDILLRAGYHSPYRLLARGPRRVLVLGAGSGNDVAVALDEGAEHVDAVEIDPVIMSVGAQHPDRPYRSPRVTTINTDARQFLNTTRNTYDLIIFGTLDSMTNLSALSSVRLDNFVYTIDCLRAAHARLTPDGGIAMYFMVGSNYIHQRLFYMLNDVFGEPPLVSNKYYGTFNDILVDGPAFSRGQNASQPATANNQLELPSDDWPFLYLQSRSVSKFYLSLIAVFACLAVVGVFWASPQLIRTARHGGMDLEMFMFGVAFLLLETKSVTEMNLVWGVTWVTSAVVFGSILIMLLAATITTQLSRISWWVCVAGLVVSLLAGYAIPAHTLLGHGSIITLLLSALFVGVPIFFASVCFALRFRERVAPDQAFGWNLLGAVGGGLLEFSSMAIGFKALSLIALGAYLIAFAFGRRQALPAVLAASVS